MGESPSKNLLRLEDLLTGIFPVGTSLPALFAVGGLRPIVEVSPSWQSSLTKKRATTNKKHKLKLKLKYSQKALFHFLPVDLGEEAILIYMWRVDCQVYLEKKPHWIVFRFGTSDSEVPKRPPRNLSRPAPIKLYSTLSPSTIALAPKTAIACEQQQRKQQWGGGESTKHQYCEQRLF